MAATYPGTATGESDPIAEADLAAHVAAADPHTQYQKESEKAQANGYASLDGAAQVPLSQLGNAPAGGGGADASTTVKGISKLSTAPASPTNPIAVGDNDPRNSDARTPTSHAASHASAGSDAVTIAESQVTGLVSDLAAKAPLASPALTGTPTVPTAAQGTNTTQAASTAYVQTESGLLIPKSLVDAKGDLLVGSADNTVIRKPVGTDGQVLTADAASAGGVKWAAGGGGGSPAAVGAQARRTTAQAIANNTFTAISFDTEIYDYGGLYDFATQPTRFTAPVKGLYLVTAMIPWSANTTGSRQIYSRINGTNFGPTVSVTGQSPSGSTWWAQLFTRPVALNAADYIEIVVWQDSGASLSTNVNGFNDASMFLLGTTP